MPEQRRWYGGMKPVAQPKHEAAPRVTPPPVEKKGPRITKGKPVQKGLPPGEESVE